jgi:hypothetical protein
LTGCQVTGSNTANVDRSIRWKSYAHDDDSHSPAAGYVYDANNLGELPHTIWKQQGNPIAELTNDGQMRVESLGLGNIESSTTLGSVVARAQVCDRDGNAVGYLPIYEGV